MIRDREVRRLAAARLVSAAGGEATFFIGIWGRAAFEMRATPGQLALVMATMGVAGLAGSLVSGTLVDRYGPRRLAVAGELAVVPSTLLLILPATLSQLAAAVALVSCTSMVAFSAIVSYPRVLTADPQRLARANAMLDVAFTAAFVIGPAGGAAVSAVVGLDAVFVVDALTSLGAVALCVGLPRVAPAADDRGEPVRWRHVMAGLRFAYQRPRLRHLFTVGAVLWLSIGFFGALEPLYFRETLGVGVATLGWVNSVFGLGMAAGAALLSWTPERFSTLPRVTALVGAAGACSMLYAGTASLGVVVVGAVLWGGVVGLVSPTVRTLAQLETPDHMMGRATGALHLHERTGDLSPLAIAPFLASAVGAQAVLVGSGVLVVLVAVVMLRAAHGLERTASGPHPHAVPAAPTASAPRAAEVARPAPVCGGQLE